MRNPGFILSLLICITVPFPRSVSAEFSDIRRVTTGYSHTCALREGGGVKCWGENGYGELGNNSRAHSSTPVDVYGLTGGVTAVSAGGSFTCAVTQGSGVKCWGYNDNGELGNNSNTESVVPVDVYGLTNGVASVTSGISHACALLLSGGVKCWGYNYDGELGNGEIGNHTSPSYSVPVDVEGLSSGVVAISASGSHTCALLDTGGVKCWGENSSGELGNNTFESSPSPVSVYGLDSGVVSIAAGGYHSCAILNSGGVKCWGYNASGQLGNHSSSNSKIPVDVSGLTSGVTSVTAGGYHTCARLSDGSARCWGLNNYGQLGTGSYVSRSAPEQVPGFTSGVISVSAGMRHSCAVLSDGSVKCWGRNNYGQVGNGSATYSLTPVSVNGLAAQVVSLWAGGLRSCALLSTAEAQCWGYNFNGDYDTNYRNSFSPPTVVSGLSGDVSAISGGASHSCALLASGNVECWGQNYAGQLGNNSNITSLTPVPVSGLSGASIISAGGAHACAALGAGGIKCWGSNSSGQLGNGSYVSSRVPVPVTGISENVAAISAGESFTCALLSSGAVKCWGQNGYGQLGDDSASGATVPVDVYGLSSGVDAISSGSWHTCALLGSGAVKCWGYNEGGLLGNGSTANARTPVDVSGLGGTVAAISAGTDHTCALLNTGGMRCWGFNNEGQLGNRSNANSLLPVDVSGLAGGISAIAAGGYHTCALLNNGVIQCWGMNDHGQLGIPVPDGFSPVSVTGTFSLYGTVFLGFSGYAGVSVNGNALGSVNTDAQGRYVFSNIPENTSFTLSPSIAGHSFSPSSVSSIIVADTRQDFSAILPEPSPTPTPVPTATATATATAIAILTPKAPKNCFSLSLSVKPKSYGTIKVSPKPNCSGIYYKEKTKITLTAKAAGKRRFKVWSGGIKNSKNKVTLLMLKNQKVTANFR